MVHEARGPQSPSRLDTLVGLVAAASGASSAVLWEDTESESGGVMPTMVAMSLDGGGPPVPSTPLAPDPTTLAAFGSRSLALPDPADTSAGASVSGAPVLAALPVDDLDGSAGALTLFGSGELTAEAFDVAADLLDVLPVLRSFIRDRQTLVLVNRCNDILRDAEMESPQEPLRPERLVEHLARVCEAIAECLGCGEVSVCLRDPGASDEIFPLVATWKAQPDVHGVQPDSEPRRMVAPLATGAQVWGDISCGAPDSPVQFARSDISVLKPVAAQVARYWSSWLQRRTISAEISSWRHLAAAVTGFNKLLADELKRKEPEDQRVYDQALQIVREVVPDCAGADVRRPARSAAGSVTLTLAHTSRLDHMSSSAETAPDASTNGAALAALVYASKRQQSITDPVAVAKECGARHDDVCGRALR